MCSRTWKGSSGARPTATRSSRSTTSRPKSLSSSTLVRRAATARTWEGGTTISGEREGSMLHPRRLALLAVALLALLVAVLPAAAESREPGGKFTPIGAFWVGTNGPQGGDGIALATSPNGHVFVGTQGGGVFRSMDDGESWEAVNNGLTATNVRALAINSGGDIF